jgi:protocatechuate 3,4-dioxygenase beta subunit
MRRTFLNATFGTALLAVSLAAASPMARGHAGSSLWREDSPQIASLPEALEMTGGTGRIAGQVTATATGKPLRAAQVSISSPRYRTRVAETDAEGRFEFGNLPPGAYFLTARKDGFGIYPDLTRTPLENRVSRTIQLADGQTIASVVISLSPAAVINGHVWDETGEPMLRANVRVLRTVPRLMRNGVVVADALVPAGGATTNDLGEFRIVGVSPGDYYLGATVSSTGSPITEGPRSGYAPTYYPGTADVSQARRITVGAGQTVSEIDFSLVPSRAYRISGLVLDSQRRPSAKVSVAVAPSSSSVGLTSTAGMGLTDGDGRFSITGVVPGDYEIRATSRAVDAAGRPAEEGRLAIAVVDRDVNGLVVVTVPVPPRPVR